MKPVFRAAHVTAYTALTGCVLAMPWWLAAAVFGACFVGGLTFFMALERAGKDLIK
jgi:hypothetical protein